MIDKWPDGGLTAFDIAARGSKRMENMERTGEGSSGGRGRASAERPTPRRRRGLKDRERQRSSLVKDNTVKSVAVGDPRLAATFWNVVFAVLSHNQSLSMVYKGQYQSSGT